MRAIVTFPLFISTKLSAESSGNQADLNTGIPVPQRSGAPTRKPLPWQQQQEASDSTLPSVGPVQAPTELI